MIDWLAGPADWLVAAGVVAADIAIKATALMVVALALNAWLARRGGVLLRSSLWNALLIMLLLLPVTTIGFPRLRVPCLPAGVASVVTDVRAAEALADGTFLPLAADERDVAPAAAAPGPDATKPIESAAGGVNAAIDVVAVQQPVAVDGSIPVPAAANAPAGARWPGARGALWWALAVYSSGVVLLLLRLALTHAALGRLRDESVPIVDGGWSADNRRIADRLGMPRATLLASGAVNVPATFGFWRPVVVIPKSLVASARRSDRLAVLLHEMTHMRRCDYGWQVLLKLLQVVYWPHPLVWTCGRQMAWVREQACDQFCVHNLDGPGLYRKALVAIAETLVRRPVRSPGIAMARRSTIEERLLWIARGYTDGRCVPSGRASTTALLAGLLLVATVGAIELAPRSGQVETTSNHEGAGVGGAPAPAEQSYAVVPWQCFFRRVVVGADEVTFEGQPTTWEKLPQQLAAVSNRPLTVLEVAVASDAMTLRQANEARNKVSLLARRYGFAYPSYVGVQPLGSTGTPTQPRSLRELPGVEVTASSATATELAEKLQQRLAALADLHLVTDWRMHERASRDAAWQETPVRAHTRSWYALDDTHRQRVDFDPVVAKWADGTTPYSETRYTIAFDGATFSRIDHVYGAESATYTSRISDRRSGYQQVPLAEALTYTGIDTLTELPLRTMLGGREENEQFGRVALHQVTLGGCEFVRVILSGADTGAEHEYLIDPERDWAVVLHNRVRVHEDGRREITWSREVAAWGDLNGLAVATAWRETGWGRGQRQVYRLETIDRFDTHHADGIFGVTDVELGVPQPAAPRGFVPPAAEAEMPPRDSDAERESAGPQIAG